MDKYQEKALASWYKEGHPLRLELRHPLIKLAGEAGELLDLYGKNEYKPNFNWWNCKYCKKTVDDHIPTNNPICNNYTPLVLDELGDWWYYLRIVMWQQQIDIPKPDGVLKVNDLTICLSKLSMLSSSILDHWLEYKRVDYYDLINLFHWFIYILNHIDYTIDDLTDLNYKKLNSEPTQHGWAKARENDLK